MRVTSFMLYNQFVKSMHKNMADMSVLSNRLSSMKKIDKPSDDVIGMSRVMDYKLDITKNEQSARNIDDSEAHLGYTDSILQSVSNLFGRAKELALEAANGEQTAWTRDMIAEEIRAVRDQLAGYGNSKFRDRYVFSGFLTDRKSFELDAGSEYQYMGDSNYIEVKVGAEAKTKINETGSKAFYDQDKKFTNVIGDPVGTGTLSISVESGNPVQIAVDADNNSPEEMRDTINAAMSKYYDPAVPELVGTGTLALKAGSGAEVSLTVDALNNTPTQLAAAINALGMGIEARVATDTVTLKQRLLFRPSTPGTPISIDVNDSDGNNTDSSGLSALLHTTTKSNLTTNALGIEANVINGTAGKRLLFSPVNKGDDFAITVNDSGDGNNTDAAGLSRLYHNPSAATNLNSSMSFFMMLDHMINSLENNDTSGINASILLLDDAVDNVLNVMADVGARLNYLSSERQGNEDRSLGIKTVLSETEDADIAETATEFAKVQTALQAMMQASSRILSQSLLDFLK